MCESFLKTNAAFFAYNGPVLPVGPGWDSAFEAKRNNAMTSILPRHSGSSRCYGKQYAREVWILKNRSPTAGRRVPFFRQTPPVHSSRGRFLANKRKAFFQRKRSFLLFDDNSTAKITIAGGFLLTNKSRQIHGIGFLSAACSPPLNSSGSKPADAGFSRCGHICYTMYKDNRFKPSWRRGSAFP